MMVASEGFEPPNAEQSDLQSDPFGRLGNSPSRRGARQCYRPRIASLYPTAAAATLRRYDSDELYAETAARQPSSVSIAIDERQR